MSDLVVRLRDAGRAPLQDRVDLDLFSIPQRPVASKRDMAASRGWRVTGLVPGQVYVVRAFPARHRPVSQFVRAPQEGETAVTLYCPVDPDRVTSVRFPAFAELDPGLQAVLARSRVEHPADLTGEDLYDGLDSLQRAGLLNLFGKASRTPLPDGSAIWGHVESLYRVRGDRVFAEVALPLRDLVKSGVVAGTFRLVSGSLHTPPPTFALADSFKSPERYGNLQVTFFSSLEAPLRFRADIDIDDASGIEHVFQVIRHRITNGATHPYDIHEILLFHQQLDLDYDLVV